MKAKSESAVMDGPVLTVEIASVESESAVPLLSGPIGRDAQVKRGNKIGHKSVLNADFLRSDNGSGIVGSPGKVSTEGEHALGLNLDSNTIAMRVNELNKIHNLKSVPNEGRFQLGDHIEITWDFKGNYWTRKKKASDLVGRCGYVVGTTRAFVDVAIGDPSTLAMGTYIATSSGKR